MPTSYVHISHTFLTEMCARRGVVNAYLQIFLFDFNVESHAVAMVLKCRVL